MKTKLLLIPILLIAGMAWGQEKNLTTLEKKYKTNFKKDAPDSLVIKSLVNNNVNINNTNTYTVEYDFKDGIYKRNNLKLKVNTPVSFKITNINRLAYDINISSKDSILAETFVQEDIVTVEGKSKNDNTNTEGIKNADGVITNPKILGVEFINIHDIADEKKKDEKISEKIKKDLTEEIPLINKLKVEIDNKIKELIELKDKKNIYEKDTIKLMDSLKIISNDKQEKIKNLKEKITKTQLSVETKNQEIIQKQDSIAKIQTDIENHTKILNEYIKKFNQDNLAVQTSFSRLRESYEVITKLKHIYQEVIAISHDPYLSKEIYTTKYKSRIEEKAQYILKHKDSIFYFKGYYNDFNIKYSYLKYNPSLNDILNYGGQIKLYSQAEYLKELADNMHKYVNENNIFKIAETLEVLLPLFECDNTYEIVSAPIQPLNDVAIFDIHISSKGNNSPVSDKKKFRHREFTYGGVRLDFSLGLAASKFPDTPVYELGAVLDTQGARQTTIVKKSNDLTVPSLLGLATMSYRKTGYITFGGSAGLGIDVVNGKIQLSNFFIGPTILFGKFDRLFLTSGFSVRNVGQLKGGYSEGNILPSGSNAIEDYITEKYKIGYFAALTYNLTKGARDTYKKIKEFQ